MSLSSLNLDAFFACAQCGNFTKAAEKLFITQSALSQRIQNLERELETSLFIRDRAGIRLTEAGLELLRYCQARDSIETEALARVRGSGRDSSAPAGTIRIGGFSSVLRSVILPALAPLLTKHQGIKLQVVSRELEDLPELLRRGEIDYMILDRDLGKEEMETQLLGEERNVLVRKKGYQGPPIYLDHHEADQVTFRYLRLSEQASKKRAKVERRYLPDVYALIDGVKLGLGQAILPMHLIKGETGLTIIESEKQLLIPVVLHFYAQPYYSQLHREVVGSLKSCLF
jgi:DNA-binding transcriptional LysR family regulator